VNKTLPDNTQHSREGETTIAMMYFEPVILESEPTQTQALDAAATGIRLSPHDIEGKAVPLQSRSGPEGSRKLRFPDFVTKAQGGGKVASLTHRPRLPPGNAHGTHFC